MKFFNGEHTLTTILWFCNQYLEALESGSILFHFCGIKFDRQCPVKFNLNFCHISFNLVNILFSIFFYFLGALS